MTEDLDLRRAFTAPGGHAPRPEECPEPATIWAAVHGELPPRELRDVVDHTATCGACAEDWRLAVEAGRDEPAVVDVRPTLVIPAITAIEETAGSLASLFPSRRARFIPLVAAAASIVLLVVGWPLLHHEQKPSVFRGVGHMVSQLHEGEALQRGNCVLLWSGPPSATYDVEVTTQLGEPLFSKRGIPNTELRVPEASLAGIRSGTSIDWKVTARVHGEVSHLSSTFTLR